MSGVSKATTPEMRAKLEGFTIGHLAAEPRRFSDILARVQWTHFPNTIGWNSAELDRTVGKWTRAALQRLRKAGKVEFVGKSMWRLAGKAGES